MFKLSETGLEKVKSELSRYETKESAIIPCLYVAQAENKGWVSDEVIDHLSEVMDIPQSKISEVFKFYTMFNQKPVGKYHVQVCCNISCALNGSRELTSHLMSAFGVKGTGQVSSDGKLSFSKVECLGSCDTAPMMQVNDRYYENLTPESAVKILRELE